MIAISTKIFWFWPDVCTARGGGVGLVAVFLFLASSSAVVGQEAPAERVLARATVPSTSELTVSVTNLLAFGDSVTYGILCPPNCADILVYGDANNETSYPAVLQGLLAARYTSQSITVENVGVPGESTAQGRVRAPTALDTYTPDLFLLEEGVNGLTEANVDSVAADLRAMAGEAEARGVPVLIATLPPLGAFQAEQDPSYAAAIVQLNVKIQQIANDLGSTTLVDVYSVFEGNHALMSNDGLHPTVAGYAAMAQAFYDAIVSAFEGLTLTVTKSGAGSGTVTSSPVGITCGDECSAAFSSGATVTLSAAAGTDSAFGEWSGTGCESGEVTLAASLTCDARFHKFFTDDTLASGVTLLKRVHIEELRTRIAAVRGTLELSVYSFDDADLSGGVTVRALHFDQLRNAIDEIYEALELTLPTYTDRPLVGGVSVIRSLHLTEIRNALLAVE